MSLISIMDTAIASDNTGDFIIMESVEKELKNLFPNSFFIKYPTHELITKASKEKIQKSSFKIVGGTNLLSSNMNAYCQWKIGIKNSLFINKVILMGVGWWQYQNRPNFYTKLLLNRVLSKQYIHSVRDKYTQQQLADIGIHNTVNTGCPTMWDLTEEHCLSIPTTKQDSVVFTLTDYSPKPTQDRLLIDILKKHYETVYFWAQGLDDARYFKELTSDHEGITVISPNLQAFNDLLASEKSIDYIGTRLHAGIKALQAQKRSIIIGIDNRAAEISKDSGLFVVPRTNIEKLTSLITGSFRTEIKMPLQDIHSWREQFKSHHHNLADISQIKGRG